MINFALGVICLVNPEWYNMDYLGYWLVLDGASLVLLNYRR